VILVDTGVIVAAADADDPDCEASIRALEAAVAPRLVHGLVIAETSYMLARNGGPGAEAPFLRAFVDGFFEVAATMPEDLARAADLVEQYRNLPLDASDAATIAVAERLGIEEILTLDGDFRIVRPTHVEAFSIKP
jgi:predicted nucleic acid-binding protein